MKLSRLPERRILRVEGSERVDFLHGQLSSDVRSLAKGAGQASLLLSAQGRVEGIVALYDTGDAIEIACDAAHIDAAQARLERFLIADDVGLVPEEAPGATFLLIGDDAPAALARLAGLSVAHGWQRSELTIAGAPAILRSRGELCSAWLEISTTAADGAMERTIASLGAQPAADDALALLHVESGVARYGVDVDETRVALEARLQWAIHFAKGCYVGQEVLERAVSRGRLNRRLALLASDVPLAVGTRVDGGSEIEIVTSSVTSPNRGPLALAYVGMESTNPGTALTVGGTPARVLEWPMREVYTGLRA